MPRRFLLLIPLVVLFVLGAVGLFRARPAAEIGEPAAAFDLPSVADPDERISLERLVGTRPLVLNFWASWCEPCKQEAPEFRRTAEAFAGEVGFLGISILDGRGPADRFMASAKIPYRSVSDTRGVVAKRYGVTGVPETVFVDPDGTVVGKYVGAFRDGELEQLVAELVALAPGERLDITGRGETRPVP